MSNLDQAPKRKELSEKEAKEALAEFQRKVDEETGKSFDRFQKDAKFRYKLALSFVEQFEKVYGEVLGGCKRGDPEYGKKMSVILSDILNRSSCDKIKEIYKEMLKDSGLVEEFKDEGEVQISESR